jgi:hypothetical protein
MNPNISEVRDARLEVRMKPSVKSLIEQTRTILLETAASHYHRQAILKKRKSESWADLATLSSVA